MVGRAPVLSALAAALFAAGTAGAAEKARTDRLAVLPIVLAGAHGQATLSGIFNDVASGAEMRLGLRVISYEEMFAASEEGLGDRVRECGSDVSCIGSKLRTFNARLGLVVVLDFASKPPLISMQLLDTDSGSMVASSVGEITGQTSETIRKGTADLLDKAGYIQAGRVIVEVAPPNARVSLGEGVDPDPGTPNRFTVAPGRYVVSAGLDGYSSEKGDAVVLGGVETKVRLELSKDTSLLESPWFWIGAGAVAVAGTLTVLVVTNKPTRCVCLVIGDQGCDPCYE